MQEITIGPAEDFENPGRKVIAIGDVEIGVFRLGEEFLAYENMCPHMGGPACQGKVIAKVDEIIAEDRTSRGMAFSNEHLNVVCPWHGYEFDIRTGVHHGNRRMRLKPIKVRVDGGDVILTLPERLKDAAAGS